MTELITELILTVISIFLLSYWLRCACLLFLAARITHSAATGFSFGEARAILQGHLIADLENLCAVAVENGLSFPQVQELIQESAGANLDRLRISLDRDYRVLAHLFSGGAPANKEMLERLVLAVNYRVLGVWYFVSRFSAPKANRVLEEMSWVVGHLAGSLPPVR